MSSNLLIVHQRITPFHRSIMNWYTLVANTLIIFNLVSQHQQILRLYRYQELDSSRLHTLYKFYFLLCFLFAVSSVDLHHFKLPALPTTPEIITTENMVSSMVFLIISMMFIVSMHTAKPINTSISDEFPAELERQLLLSTDTFKSRQPVVQVVSSPIVKHISPTGSNLVSKNLSHSALRSKDISPIQSYGNQPILREMLQTSPAISTHTHNSPSSNRGRKFSAVKTPILATLLNAENVIAIMSSDTDSQQQQQPLSSWLTALPIIITTCYIVSQILYTISIVKTNVYTPYRNFLLTSIWSMLLGTLIIVTTICEAYDIAGPFSSLIQYPLHKWVNYAFGIALVIHGITSFVYWIILTRRKTVFYPDTVIDSVQVYNSISSPSLHSVY